MGGPSTGGGGNGAGMLENLEILIENLRKECYMKFLPREDFDEFKMAG